MRTSNPQPSIRAFSLVELLAVVTIIGVLATLLLPAVSRAKLKTQGMVCRNNLRQLQLAWTVYSGDSNDKLVRSGGVNCLVQNPNDPRARAGLAQWVLGSMRVAPSWTNEALIQRGLLWQYVGDVGVYKCPADQKTASDGKPTLRSMAMNCWLNPIVPWPARGKVFRTQDDFVALSASKCWVLIDQYNVDDGWFVCAPAGNLWIDQPGPRHNGGPWSGLSFADGHVELRKWTDCRMFVDAMGPVSSDPASGDLRWLQQGATILQ